MTQTKLIRHGMDRLAPIPEDCTKEFTTDVHLIKALLVAKLTEEGQEVAQARSRQELLNELGDIYEVLHSLAVMHGFHMRQVADVAAAKADERGPLLIDQCGVPCAVLMRVSLP